jgi:hypothetical protein
MPQWWIDDLNREQLRAATAGEGPILIVVLPLGAYKFGTKFIPAPLRFRNVEDADAAMKRRVGQG